MIVYHGTTDRRARRICEEGFAPRKPSRRVWFARGKGYALRRAKTQARRSRDHPVVLTCNIDVAQLKARVGSKRVFYGNGILAVNAHVPVSVLRGAVPEIGQPTSPEELAAWVNRLLGLKPWKGVGRHHPGIERLSRWVVNRRSSQRRSRVDPGELLQVARRWLPEFFEGVEVDPKRVQVTRKTQTIEVEVDTSELEIDAQEEEAIGLLEDAGARRRVRGLSLLAEIGEPDLFDWCAMLLDDEAVSVRLAALRTMLLCEDGDPEVIAPLARSGEKRVRAAAIAALARHSGEDAGRWVARGLKDPCPCVRVAASMELARVDPAGHHALFELALYDHNREVARRARRLVRGKGFAKVRW